jgi:cytochrome c556
LEKHGDVVTRFRSAVPIAVALLVLLGGVALAVSAGEVVQTRRGIFDQMTDALKYTVNHWDDSANYGNLARAAAFIERNARTLPKLFPTGTSQSDGLRTAAADAIWSDRPGFERLANLLAEQSARLAQTTASTNSTQVRSEINDVVATCKSCHRDFRN